MWSWGKIAFLFMGRALFPSFWSDLLLFSKQFGYLYVEQISREFIKKAFGLAFRELGGWRRANKAMKQTSNRLLGRREDWGGKKKVDKHGLELFKVARQRKAAEKGFRLNWKPQAMMKGRRRWKLTTQSFFGPKASSTSKDSCQHQWTAFGITLKCPAIQSN